MSDLELYIYIGLALIYFLTRALKQKKAPRPPGNYKNTSPKEQESSSGPVRERPMTFEELLKEFTGYKEPPQTVTPAAEEKEIEEEYVETIEEDHEYQTYEGYDDYKKSGYTSYDEVYGKSQNLTTIDEQISLDEPLERQFEEYETQLPSCDRAKKYRQMLMRRESIRDAFILKELLDPKYV
jgi:hypothetical protein